MITLNKLRDALIGGMILFLISACSTAQTASLKKHHRADGYVNNTPQESPGIADMLDFGWESMTSDSKSLEYPIAQNDPIFLQNNITKPTITWVGHTTFLIQLGGVNILTDPQFSERASPISWVGPKRYTPPGLSLEELPVIDFVIISHNHYDHLDLATIQTLQKKQSENPPLFFVPLGLKSWFKDIEIENVKEMDWWDQDTFKGFTLHSVPIQHYSNRTPWDRNESLWTGWVIEYHQRSILFVGDTGYSNDFKEIGKRFGPIDLSLLPIGAYEPRRFMKPIHVNPKEAVKIHQDVSSRYSIGMHWGTFSLTTEDMDEPPRYLKQALKKANISENEFFVMQHGETKMLNFLLN
ncbi:MAG: MBL fold metallo-hydrolase [Bermanella sp.]